MVCKTCKLLVAGRCMHIDLPVGNLDPACEKYSGPIYKDRRYKVSDYNDDDEWEDDEDEEYEDYYDDDEEYDDDDYDDDDDDDDYDNGGDYDYEEDD